MKPSARIMVHLRSHRSMYTPAKGPMMVCGRKAAIAAYASTSADPVSRLSQMMMAKLTAELLSRDTNCPVQMMANVFFHGFVMAIIKVYSVFQGRDGNTRKSDGAKRRKEARIVSGNPPET